MIRLMCFPTSGNTARAETLVRDNPPNLARHAGWQQMVTVLGMARAVLFVQSAIARRRAVATPRPINPDTIWRDR